MSCGVSSEGVYTYTMTLPFVSLSCGLRFGLPEFRRVFTSFFVFLSPVYFYQSTLVVVTLPGFCSRAPRSNTCFLGGG